MHMYIKEHKKNQKEKKWQTTNYRQNICVDCIQMQTENLWRNNILLVCLTDSQLEVCHVTTK